MSDNAHDMSRFWRIFTYQHGRINGTFIVYSGKYGVHNVKPLEVTIYADEAHSWGRVIYGQDFTAFVRNGVVEVPPHMIRECVRPEIEDAIGELIGAIAECVAAFPESGDPS